ncbi:MAG: acetyl-CoA decarbonylase/synthase complex subunit gamma [Chitinispirillaceae bacterium]|nr:acetyl-CoA decarbonylase/synthase complex subunit gamma [Chitinispirillaceae bacterium]
MAKKLTGMEIFKLLPKTNCGECGVPTCMAFAMKLAQKNAELATCPYASDKAKEVIGAAAEPPVRKISFGEQCVCGNELVMFRHEKTFVHQTIFACRCFSDLSPDNLTARCRKAQAYCLERVGEELRIESVLIDDRSDSINAYVASVETAAASFTGGIILKTGDPARLKAAAEKIASRTPLLFGASIATIDEIAPFALELKLPVVLSAPSLDELHSLSNRCSALGLRDLVLNPPAGDGVTAIQLNSIIRKSGLGGVKPFGYPIITMLPDIPDPFDFVSAASGAICKYSSILVFDTLENEVLLPLMMLRQNIYTDPQKPIQVEPGLYYIGEVSPASPILITTNFSLTYFIVSGEIEASGVGAHLAVVESEGMSVLTAWAAGKFSGEKIAQFLKEKNVDNSYTSRKLVIPGYVATISGELEEQMPGWEVQVGPQEASDIAPFLKRLR